MTPSMPEEFVLDPSAVVEAARHRPGLQEVMDYPNPTMHP